MIKNVKIKEMHLVNFKGIKNLAVDFGQTTEIRGANATGKSSIADAFTWLLFGKDTAGNSDTKFGIKTVDSDGQVIPKLDHEVSATLLCNDNPVTLRRVLSEDWVTPRGSATPVLKGNTTSYFCNDVPLKESDYKAKVSEIISEDLFRMLTSPLYFPNLKWEEQRAMLLQIAGDVSLEEIATGKPEFEALLAQLSGKSLADFKAEIAVRKKKIKEALESIPARIDEVKRATPDAPDYTSLISQKALLETEIGTVDAAISNAAELSKQDADSQRELQAHINDLKAKQQQVLFDAQQEARKAYNEENAAYAEAETKLSVLERQSKSLNNEIAVIKSRLQKYNEHIDYLTRQLEALRERWKVENAKEYKPEASLICPKCGHDLKSADIEMGRSDFDIKQAAALERINDEGLQLKAEKEALESKNEALRQEIADLSDQLKTKTQEIDDLRGWLNGQTRSEYVEPQGDSIPEYMTLEANIIEFSNALQNRPAIGDTSEFQAKKNELTAQLDAIKKQLALKDVIDANNARLKELMQEEKSLAQQKADLEKQEFTAENLVKAQMNCLEERINKLFRLCRFEMFEQQLNGGEKATCICRSTTDGAKYMDVNSAQKIQIGLDIIRALQEYNGTFAPIFIDNAESVNNFPEMPCQMVFLRVTDDKKLTINTL